MAGGTSANRQPDPSAYPPIESYGVIGDLRTVALIGPRAQIDQLCLPRFDSPSIFAAHVDREKGGCFRLEPRLENAVEKKLYFPGTNILLSRFLSEDGIAEVSDFMYIDEAGSRQVLVRRAKCVHGSARFSLRCAPRFDYARAEHTVEIRDGEAIFRSESEALPRLRLASEIPLRAEGGDAVAEFELAKGETAVFALDDGQAEIERPLRDFSAAAFKATSNYWHKWISACRYNGRWQEAVHRSALALKLLVDRDHGSIIASGTFGFPSDPGGERNWDYRLVWIRDASFTLYAFLRLGFRGEAEAFIAWLERRIQELDDGAELQTMYKIDGSPVSGEARLDHFEGYQGSLPVRVGSTNHNQRQLDIYGEILDAVYLYDTTGRSISRDFWLSIRRLIGYVLENWMQPDSSIWEIRDGYREFLYSRVMCWVALDRGIRLAENGSKPAPIDEWRGARDKIYESVFADFWNEEKQAFTQFKGSDALDAAALIMPLVGFISPTDPQWVATLKAIQEELVEDSLVYRYRVNEAFSDRLEGRDGTFSICSFWYIECVSRGGDLPRARYLLEKMLSYASDLGLYTEQIGARGEALGNIPQAFTHLALISAVYDLDRRLSRADPEISGGAD